MTGIALSLRESNTQCVNAFTHAITNEVVAQSCTELLRVRGPGTSHEDELGYIVGIF